MNTADFIEENPKIMNGQPVIKGTRITVQQIIEPTLEDVSVENILIRYPQLSKIQIKAAIQFVIDRL